MWKYRCDNLKRDVMEQLKGMGDKMNWETYYPDGKTPLDEVEVERHTERTLLSQVEDSSPIVERSTIEKILTSLNSGGNVQEVLARTEISTLQPPPRFRGRSLVEELVTGFAGSEERSPLLVYDRQAGKWQFPDYFTAAYMQNAREYKSEEVCTVLDVFTAAPEVESLDGLGGCDILYLPELNVDDPYYNPLFMTQQARDEYNRGGSLDILRQVYMSHDKSSSKREESRWERIRRQLAAAAIAGGYLAHSAVDTVLDWFGYHKTGGEVVKHVNANMDHVKVVSRHVEHMESITKKMFESLGLEDEKERLMELYLHLSIAVEVLFDRIRQMSRGLDQLGLHKRVSPHLVKAHEMQQQVYSLQTELHGSTEVLLISAGSDVWNCPASYVISPDLEIAVMVHIPVAQRASYMYLYKYVSTPLVAPKGNFHILVFPKNRLLSINREAHLAREMGPVEYQQCKAVGNGPQYCPSPMVQMSKTQDTCLTGLYGNEMQLVVDTCPFLHLNESQAYAVALSPQHFSVYLPQEATGRVTCGTEFLGSVTLPAGLREVAVDPLCKVVAPQLTLEPKLRMSAHEVRFDRIKLNLTSLDDFAEPIKWALGKDKVATHLDEVGPSLKDIETTWKEEKLHSETHLGLLAWVGIIVGSALALVILVCSCKCGWECYTRRRNREQLKTNIRDHVLALARQTGEEEHEMDALKGVPSAPPSE